MGSDWEGEEWLKEAGEEWLKEKDKEASDWEEALIKEAEEEEIQWKKEEEFKMASEEQEWRHLGCGQHIVEPSQTAAAASGSRTINVFDLPEPLDPIDSVYKDRAIQDCYREAQLVEEKKGDVLTPVKEEDVKKEIREKEDRIKADKLEEQRRFGMKPTKDRKKVKRYLNRAESKLGDTPTAQSSSSSGQRNYAAEVHRERLQEALEENGDSVEVSRRRRDQSMLAMLAMEEEEKRAEEAEPTLESQMLEYRAASSGNSQDPDALPNPEEENDVVLRLAQEMDQMHALYEEKVRLVKNLSWERKERKTAPAARSKAAARSIETTSASKAAARSIDTTVEAPAAANQERPLRIAGSQPWDLANSSNLAPQGRREHYEIDGQGSSTSPSFSWPEARYVYIVLALEDEHDRIRLFCKSFLSHADACEAIEHFRLLISASGNYSDIEVKRTIAFGQRRGRSTAEQMKK